MFEGVRDRFSLKFKSARTFRNGNVLLSYEPARQASPSPRRRGTVPLVRGTS